MKNRVIEIKNNNCVIFAHADTKDNPADVATRGASVSDLKDNTFWWNGPTWCCESQRKCNTNHDNIIDMELKQHEDETDQVFHCMSKKMNAKQNRILYHLVELTFKDIQR
jgi:hypothetical protein